MATHDRFILEPLVAEISAPQKREITQGELFARLALRTLPVMKHGPEDEWAYTPTKLH